MKLRYQLALIVLVPLATAGILAASGQRVTVPLFGREYVLRIPLAALDDGLQLPAIAGPEGSQYPLILIDPGHGGFDYGATGSGYREKDIVLGLALDLRKRLLEAGDLRVAMTRDGDRFIPLEERRDLARQLGADLFLSIHADSAGEKSDVAGASIYTMSGEASSRAAAEFAARENSAGQINGVSLSGSAKNVDDILVELSRRQSMDQSQRFAELVERSGEGLVAFHPQAQRSASLVVLQSPDVPSVLFEAGFVTNSGDAARLASDKGRQNFAQAMASAVRAYFVTRRNPIQPSDS